MVCPTENGFAAAKVGVRQLGKLKARQWKEAKPWVSIFLVGITFGPYRKGVATTNGVVLERSPCKPSSSRARLWENLKVSRSLYGKGFLTITSSQGGRWDLVPSSRPQELGLIYARFTRDENTFGGDTYIKKRPNDMLLLLELISNLAVS